MLTWNSPLASVNLGRWVNKSATLMRLLFPFVTCSELNRALLITKDLLSPKYSLFSRVTQRFRITFIPSEGFRQIRDTPRAWNRWLLHLKCTNKSQLSFQKIHWTFCRFFLKVGSNNVNTFFPYFKITLSCLLKEIAHLWDPYAKSLLTTSFEESRVTDLVTMKLKTWVSSESLSCKYLVRSAMILVSEITKKSSLIHNIP